MLTRDTESATKCTICNSWIDKSWHNVSETVCPTCVIGTDFGHDKAGEKA